MQGQGRELKIAVDDPSQCSVIVADKAAKKSLKASGTDYSPGKRRVSSNSGQQIAWQSESERMHSGVTYLDPRI